MSEVSKPEIKKKEEPLPEVAKAYSVHADKNYPKRRTMEDAHYICDPILTVEGHQYALYSIFDGHGGKTASLHCSKVVGDKVKEVLARDETYEEKMQDIFCEIDQSIKEAGIEYPGCCGLVCILDKYEDKTKVIIANAGDSMGYIIGEEIIPMSEMHNTSNEEEVKRIQEAGGMIFSGRVNGTIAVTRSLGDAYMKKYLVSEPFVKEHEVTEKDKYVVLACDGLYDVLDADKIKEILEEVKDFKTSAKTLIQKAIAAGSTDNISVIVIQL